MKTASIKELKTELNTLATSRLIELCMQLSKYKKENKELLSYLLFEASDEQLFIKEVKKLIDDQFECMNKSNLYLVKKTLRKILRTTNKYIKYSGIKQTQVELLLYFCKKIRKEGIPVNTNLVIGNIYKRQVQKIKEALATLHEDLQFDFADDIKALSQLAY